MCPSSIHGFESQLYSIKSSLQGQVPAACSRIFAGEKGGIRAHAVLNRTLTEHLYDNNCGTVSYRSTLSTQNWQRFDRGSIRGPLSFCGIIHFPHHITLWVRVERERERETLKGKKTVGLLSTKNTWASCGQMQAASYTRRQAAIEWEMLGFEPVYTYAYAGKKHNKCRQDTKRSRLMIHSHI